MRSLQIICWCVSVVALSSFAALAHADPIEAFPAVYIKKNDWKSFSRSVDPLENLCELDSGSFQFSTSGANYNFQIQSGTSPGSCILNSVYRCDSLHISLGHTHIVCGSTPITFGGLPFDTSWARANFYIPGQDKVFFRSFPVPFIASDDHSKIIGSCIPAEGGTLIYRKTRPSEHARLAVYQAPDGTDLRADGVCQPGVTISLSSKFQVENEIAKSFYLAVSGYSGVQSVENFKVSQSVKVNSVRTLTAVDSAFQLAFRTSRSGPVGLKTVFQSPSYPKKLEVGQLARIVGFSVEGKAVVAIRQYEAKLGREKMVYLFVMPRELSLMPISTSAY